MLPGAIQRACRTSKAQESWNVKCVVCKVQQVGLLRATDAVLNILRSSFFPSQVRKWFNGIYTHHTGRGRFVSPLFSPCPVKSRPPTLTLHPPLRPPHPSCVPVTRRIILLLLCHTFR